LESELKKGRISFAWTNMFGVGGLVAGSASVTTASIGGGAFLIGRTVKYAFDRDALVRDHPFGYLHRVRTSLVDGRTDMSHSPYLPLDKPVPDLETLLAKAYLAAFRVDPHSDFMTAVMIGDRTADPASAARYITRRAREKEIPSAWWTDRSV
jgi:hypothetical protein